MCIRDSRGSQCYDVRSQRGDAIIRRDTGESYTEFLTKLATASGMGTSRSDAKITKMKDGRTHLAHKVEHAVDMESGAILAVTLQDANAGDTTTIEKTLIAAAEQIEQLAAAPETANIISDQPLAEVVTDKGYHSNAK